MRTVSPNTRKFASTLGAALLLAAFVATLFCLPAAAFAAQDEGRLVAATAELVPLADGAVEPAPSDGGATEPEPLADDAADSAASTGEATDSTSSADASAEPRQPASEANPQNEAVAVEMFRTYNPNSGEHFYTSSAEERDVLALLGWRTEGVGWVAPSVSNTPVYRLYSGTDHHYTIDAGERDALVEVGWSYEGIGWYSDDERTCALLRLYNPNVQPSAAWNNAGSHHFSTSEDESEGLVAAGWKFEGVAWYALAGGYGGGDWVASLAVASQTDQIIAVEARGLQATVSMHEKRDGVWQQTMCTNEGWIGRDGLGPARADIAYTPTGVMFPTEAFGIQPDPGCPMGYLQVDWSHYWVGDSESPLYNLMVSTRDRDDFATWESEHIITYGPTYNYCLNMGWNIQRTPYGGSAFFLHCSMECPTAGCVTVPEPMMIDILRAVRPGCAIVIDTPSGVMQY